VFDGTASSGVSTEIDFEYVFARGNPLFGNEQRLTVIDCEPNGVNT